MTPCVRLAYGASYSAVYHLSRPSYVCMICQPGLLCILVCFIPPEQAIIHVMTHQEPCRSCKRSTTHRIGCPDKGSAAGVVFIVAVSDSSWKGAPEFQLLVELLAALSDPAHQFLIHLDLNSSPEFKDRIIQTVMHTPRVALVQHPFPCFWAGMTPGPSIWHKM